MPLLRVWSPQAGPNGFRSLWRRLGRQIDVAAGSGSTVRPGRLIQSTLLPTQFDREMLYLETISPGLRL